MKSGLIKLVITVLCLWGVYPAYAQSTLTLDMAIKEALTRNFNIKIAKNNQKMAENNINIGNAGLLPKIDIKAGSQYTDMETTSPLFLPKYTYNFTTLEITYTLFDGLNNVYTYKKLKTDGIDGKLQARNIIENTLLQVTSGYYNLAKAADNVKIWQDAIQISTERLKRTEKRYNFGQADKIDILNAKVDLHNDSISYVSASTQYEQAVKNLNLLLGREKDLPFKIDTNVIFLQLPGEEELIQQALKQNSGYLLALNSLKKANLSKKMSMAVNIPRIDIRGSYGYNQTVQDFNLSFDDRLHSYSTSATMTFNLFNGFKNKIQYQNAKIAEQNSQLQIKEIKLELMRDIHNTYSLYLNDRYILHTAKKNLELAKLNFIRSKELYDLGQITTTRFREAQLNLMRAGFSLSQAKYNTKISETELLKLSGMLTEQNQ